MIQWVINMESVGCKNVCIWHRLWRIWDSFPCDQNGVACN